MKYGVIIIQVKPFFPWNTAIKKSVKWVIERVCYREVHNKELISKD